MVDTLNIGTAALTAFAVSLIPLGWLTVQDIRCRRSARNQHLVEKLRSLGWAVTANGGGNAEDIVQRHIKPLIDKLEAGEL